MAVKDKAEAQEEATLFTKEEVKFAVATTLSVVLRKSLDLLLHSGAAPSAEVGAVIMHLAGGNKHVTGEVIEMAKTLSTNPGGVERVNMLQEIVNGQVH